MKLKSIKEEEISMMSFDDLAYVILKEKGKKMKTPDLFKLICDLQNLGEKFFEEQIADFFALLATEKRFIQLDKGYWDLKENHTNKVSINSVDEEVLEDEDMTIQDDNSEDEEEYIDDNKEIDDDETEDDLKDLVVMEETTPSEEIDI